MDFTQDVTQDVTRDVTVSRRRAPSAALLLACAALAACGNDSGGEAPATRREGSDPIELPAGSWSVRDGDLCYAYHRLTDSESLFDLAADPECLENLAGSRPDDCARLRALLLERAGVEKLRDLPYDAVGTTHGTGRQF